MDHPVASPASRLAEFVRSRLERLICSYQQWITDGDAEAIHDFRVNCRRLSEPLGVISTCGFSGKADSVRKSLTRFRRALRIVRDYDVLLGSLAQQSDCAQLAPEALAQLEGIFTSRRTRYFNKAASRVDALRPRRIQRGLEDLIQAFERRIAEGDEAGLMDTVQETWRRRALAVLREAPTDAEPRSLHPLRISFKKLRYCTDLLYELKQRTQDAFMGRCREMQDRLGAWNDHIFAARVCSRLATRESLLAAQTAWCAQLLDYALVRARAAQAQRQELIRFWPTAQAAIEAELATNGAAPPPQSSDAAPDALQPFKVETPEP